MSDHEDTSLNTGFSTPVPELDDHTRHQSASSRTAQSRRPTFDTAHSPAGNAVNAELLDAELLRTKARDFGEEAVYDEEDVHDEESAGPSPILARQTAARSRRGTVTTIDPRSASPPSSVKAFADARRRERELSGDENELRRTFSRASGRSIRSQKTHRSRLTAQRTNDDARSVASSNKSAEDDVCFPFYNDANRDGLQIDFQGLEDFIAEEEERAKTPPENQPHRIFTDLRPAKPEPVQIFTADGDYISVGCLPLKEEITEEKQEIKDPSVLDGNRFEFFTSTGETTIHAAEFGDLILPGEDIRTLFTFPEGQEEDGVWWLNMNSPTEEEIRAICKSFGIHPLTIEDIGTQEAREKIELFPSYYFACFRSFQVVEEEDGQEYEPFNIYVIVFREGTLSFSFAPNKHASKVRERVSRLKDYMSLSSDWICYALIDDIVDCFLPIIHKIEAETDTIEDQVFTARSDDMHPLLRQIGMVRKNVMGLMRLLGGKADVLKGFAKRCNSNYKVTPRMDIGIYLGDIQDHVVTMMTNLGHFEKMLSRSHSNYLAQLSIDHISHGNKSNKVLAKITVIASVLVPLNLITGLFGMNVRVPWAPQSQGEGTFAPFCSIVGILFAWIFVTLWIAKKLKFI